MSNADEERARAEAAALAAEVADAGGAITAAQAAKLLQRIEQLDAATASHAETISRLSAHNLQLAATLAQQQAEASNQLQPPPGVGSCVQLTERFYRLQDLHKLACGLKGSITHCADAWRVLMRERVEGVPEDFLDDAAKQLDPAVEKCETMLRLLDVEYAAIQAGATSVKDKGAVADRYYARVKGKALAPTAEDKKLQLGTVDLQVQHLIEESLNKRSAAENTAAGSSGGGQGGRGFSKKGHIAAAAK